MRNPLVAFLCPPRAQETPMTDLIQRQLDLPASPAEVWQALTDPAWLESWLADAVLLELWPGGEAQFIVGGRVRTGWVEEVCAPGDEGHEEGAGRLAFWWAQDGEPATRVELALSPLERGTRLRVSETRPLQVLDLVGIPLPGQGGSRFGPALVAA
jgi:uncharacterized protein YndB with AHSA1/START domain